MQVGNIVLRTYLNVSFFNYFVCLYVNTPIRTSLILFFLYHIIMLISYFILKKIVAFIRISYYILTHINTIQQGWQWSRSRLIFTTCPYLAPYWLSYEFFFLPHFRTHKNYNTRTHLAPKPCLIWLLLHTHPILILALQHSTT